MSTGDVTNPYLDDGGNYRPRRMSPGAEGHPAYAAARRSWAATNAKRKQDWLANWTDDGCIEDPVGPSMFDPDGVGHRGPERLEEFWDKAVATPDHIEFRFDLAIAAGDELLCIGTMRTHVGSDLMDFDIAINYRVDASGKLTNLRAFWEQEAAMAAMRPLTDDDRAAIATAIRPDS